MCLLKRKEGRNKMLKENNKQTSRQFHISIDPGFDSFKVIINGMYFKIPRDVLRVDLDSNKILTDSVTDNYICYTNKLSAYYVGSYARMLSHSINKSTTNSIIYDEKYTSVDYFMSKEFTIGLEAVVGYAIYRYLKEVDEVDFQTETDNFSKAMDLDVRNYEIILSLAFPHKYQEEYGEKIRKEFAKQHTFSLEVGTNKTMLDIKFTIDPANTFDISQTIASIMGQMVDNSGNTKNISELLPTIVLDGGYLTFGIVAVNEMLMVNSDFDESNLEFTMNSINKKVGEEIAAKTGRTDIKDYGVDEKILKDSTIKYIDSETGKAATFDIKACKEEIIKDTFNNLKLYINQKFNHLLDIKTVHIAGGTGVTFADMLKDEYVKNTAVLSEDSIILTQGSKYDKDADTHTTDKKDNTITVGYLENDNYSATFGVVVGTYRAVEASLNV